MASQASRKPASDGTVIPDRLYFKIGDVARILGLETYVLRFWETQFPQLKPNKSGTGQRLYRRRDVELALEIKRLVHKQGYTLAGARQALDVAPSRRASAQPAQPAQPTQPVDAAAQSPMQRPAAVKAAIAQARSELREISAILAAPQPTARRERAKVVKVRPDADSLFPM